MYIVWFGLAVLCLPVSGARAETGCVAAGCHTKFSSPGMASIHRPVQQAQCVVCHPRRDGAAVSASHKPGEMLVPVGDKRLCLPCHAPIAAAMKRLAPHRPVTTLACTFCHDPHQAARSSLLRATVGITSDRPSCERCHPRFEGKIVHKPLQDRSCSACHPVHGAAYAGLLVSSQVALCKGCHELSWMDQPYLHGPVRAGLCGACHNSHASDEKGLLRYPRKRLCVSCHADAQTRHRHRIVEQAEADCEACHAVHAATRPDLLKEGK